MSTVMNTVPTWLNCVASCKEEIAGLRQDVAVVAKYRAP